jgi:hypothetical protein
MAKKYAYCSDTAYYEKIILIIEGVDLLYHEATSPPVFPTKPYCWKKRGKYFQYDIGK